MAINRDKVLEAAQKYVEKKKYDKAIVEYQRLIAADPNDARTLLKVGDLQAKQGTYAEAISTYESVGKLYAQQGFALKAIAVYKQIREIIAKHVPQLEERYGHITPKLAELYQQLGLTSDALAALDEVATRLQRQQRDPEAIEVFRRIVELDPTNPLPHLRLAEALSRVRDVDGAVHEFRTAAQQLAGIGRRDDALKVLERLLHHRPEAEQAKVAAELYLARGQPQDGMQALAKLQICFQANPRDFDTLSLLARAFTTIGQGAKAIEVQKEMARVARDSGKQDLFREIVERLMRVAPHDEGVRKLASQTGSVAAVGHLGQSGGYGAGPSGPYAHAQAPHAAPPPHAQAPHAPPTAVPQTQTYGSPNAPTFGTTAPMAQPHRPGGAPLGTQPLQRPMTGGAVLPAGHGSSSQGVQAPPEPIEPEDDGEIEELSYEEVEADDVLEEVSDAELVAEDEHGLRGSDAGSDGVAYASAEEEYLEGGEDLATDAAGDSAAYADDAGDVTEQLHKVIADANAFRRVRLYNKALETLRIGFDIEPRSMDLHEVYRDVLIEAGQTDQAIDEMLAIAGLYIDALDGESAARALQDVLAFDPQNARAIEMLQELGYEIVDENEGAAQVDGGETEAAYGGGAALPSYDLEEMGAADVSSQYADDRQIRLRNDAREDGDAEALPSFPLEEPESHGRYAESIVDADEHVEDAAYGNPSEPGEDPYQTAPGEAQLAASAAYAAPVSASGGGAAAQELEDALDEAEFFCSRGLFDDARALVNDQLAKHPHHPLLHERLAEIDAQEAQKGSGAREKPRDGADQDRAFDIAASLDALENLDDQFQPAEGFSEGGEQVDVEEVFAKFKEGVAKQISVDDSDSHYNLGIAYKEMMLVDDAIREFEIAARDPKRECVCRSMIGMIHIERGNLNEAIDAFLGGLNAAIKDPQQETVLCYEIGAAYEAKKMLKDALSYYQKAMRRDPNYRDVQERVRRLAKNEPKAPLKVAAGADDEFDRAFDDLLSKA